MKSQLINNGIGLFFLAWGLSSCAPEIVNKSANRSVPERYFDSKDSLNSGNQRWQDYFADPLLIALIDTAMNNNQELNIFIQEIEIANNEVRVRKGEYLPFVGLGAGAGIDKVGQYTRIGSLESNLEIKPGQEFPEIYPDYIFGAFATWEIDIWKKLRNAKKSALTRYLATIEGRNFMVTNLISEIANSYYELLALDNHLALINQTIEIQSNALQIVKLQKQAARVTELAVRRFEAQVAGTKSLRFNIQQTIVETENRINFLVGRFPRPIQRNSDSFLGLVPDSVFPGVPSQLLENRPDIRRAEMELTASKLDIEVARANFYPKLGIRAGIGFNAYNPADLLLSPQSLVFAVAADLIQPLVNRNAIKAQYYSANAKQIQAVYEYEKTVLNAYMEVVNQISNISNLHNSYELKQVQVEALAASVEIAGNLFKSARADYMEVLLTQRDALESRMDLIETKMAQMHSWVNIYRALGGGWK